MTATSPAPKPRRSRLQFSLRLLLLAFTAFAIGFPIWYRWPFEETEVIYSPNLTTMPTRQTVTTWRRKWGGGKAKHGLQTNVNPPQKAKSIAHYQDDVLHGHYAQFLNDRLMWEGNYDHGQREGTWIDYDGDTTYTAHWHQNKLDGLYEIVFQDGRKQQFHFVMGRLIDAHGQPVKNRLLEQLAAGSIDNSRIATELQRAMPFPMEFVETPLKDAVTFLQDANNLPIVIDVRRVSDVDRPLTLNINGIDLCSALTLLAATHDLAFEYRYGVLRLTTAEHAEDQRDLTRVNDIRPLPGSPLAGAWNEPSRIEAVETPLDAALQQLAQPLAIGFDLTALPPESQTQPVTLNLKNRSLKHALGLILDQLDLRCEARGGDTIVVLPQK